MVAQSRCRHASKRLLGLKLISDLKWNSYVGNIAKDTWNVVTPGSTSILYRYLQGPYQSKMEFGWQICAVICPVLTVQTSVQKLCGWWRIIWLLFNRKAVASLSLNYRYFHDRCSHPPCQVQMSQTCAIS